jgi:hypothetical protein
MAVRHTNSRQADPESKEMGVQANVHGRRPGPQQDTLHSPLASHGCVGAVHTSPTARPSHLP